MADNRRADDDEPQALETPAPETSAYHQQDLAGPSLRSFETAQAVGSTPGELVAALAGKEGPFTPEQIQAALEEYRQREIPAG